MRSYENLMLPGGGQEDWRVVHDIIKVVFN